MAFESEKGLLRSDPVRPALGPLFFAALGAWGTILVVEEITWRAYLAKDLVAPPALPELIGMALVVGALVFALVRARKRKGPARGEYRRALLVVAAVGACALACAAFYWTAWAAEVDAFTRSGADLGSGAVLELLDDGAVREYGTVSAAKMQVGGYEVRLRLSWPEGVQPLGAGHRVKVQGRLSLPDDDEGGHWNHQQGYVGMVFASSAEDAGMVGGPRGVIAEFRDVSFSRISALGGEQAGLLAGILLGNRTLYRQTELEHDFQTTGLAHLMAVSGTHLAVVMALVSWVLERVRVPRLARTLLTSVLLVSYVALTCFSPSAIRACAMCVTGLFAGSFARRPHAITALSLCVIVFLALDPTAAYSLSLQLSALAILGLIVFTPLISAWLARAFRGHLENVADAMAATFAATAGTLALTVPLFAQLPLISPLATLVVSPLVTAALGLGIVALLVAAVLAPLGQLLLGLAAVLAGICAWLVHGLADLPGACIPVDAAGPALGVVLALCAVALWARWPLPKDRDAIERAGTDEVPFACAVPRRGAVVLSTCVFACIILLMASIAFTRPNAVGAPDGPEVVMLDVGQGDATLVREGNAAVLIDTGKDAGLLKKALARHGVTHLDAVYLSHKDNDHCGALPDLAGVVGVDHVFVHADLLSNPIEAEVLADARQATGGKEAEGVRVGDVTRVGHFTLTLVAPVQGGESENEDSLVQLLSYDADGDGQAEARGLFTGDAESEATEPLAQGIGDIDVLKVAHHGSRAGHTATELSVLKPEIALIGVGADNRYGHPTHETLSLLAAARAKVYRTDLNGDIAVSFSPTRLGVTVQKGT
jgi:competence protein ComEC